MTGGVVHVVGAGLAGLSAAVRLAERGVRVEVHEGAAQAGGRCRSYFDPQLGMTIDNGNHLVLSGNHAMSDYLRAIGAEDQLAGPEHARIAFLDLESGARWSLSPSDGPIPWWLLDPARRTPGAGFADHLQLAKLVLAPPQATIGEVVKPRGPIWRNLLAPVLLAALNTEPELGSARLAGAVIRETLAKGAAFCRPRIARANLAATFIEPALALLRRHGARVNFGARVAALDYSDQRVSGFATRAGRVVLGPHDLIVLAAPAAAAQELAPQISAPNEFRAIVNAHFKIDQSVSTPHMLGVIGGAAEWIFVFPDRISVTVSAADRLLEINREELANALWRDVARACGLDGQQPPPWQIVKERRATFAATPAQARRRPGARTAWRNLLLAGDWTDTGLPATIEGAIRSGRTAADIALAMLIQ